MLTREKMFTEQIRKTQQVKKSCSKKQELQKKTLSPLPEMSASGREIQLRGWNLLTFKVNISSNRGGYQCVVKNQEELEHQRGPQQRRYPKVQVMSV